jgi:glycosyltransferase involved in cell wall biosynthesis
MALIEAMACGAPVITTYSGAIPEIAGDAAVLCQPNDFVSLYEAVKSLAADAARRKEMSEAGRARALERFTLPALANALSDVYESMSRG